MRHKQLIPLLLAAILTAACDVGTNDYVTSALSTRAPGELGSTSLPADSVRATKEYRESVGLNGTMFAGRYGNDDAFAVLKFLRPSTSTLSTVTAVNLRITVYTSWSEGPQAYDLYSVNSDWSDTTAVDPGMFDLAGAAPVSTFGSEDSLSVVRFPVDTDVINSWGSYGTFLLKAAPDGMTLMSLYSDNSLSIPVLELITTTQVRSDTTTVLAREGTYYLGEDISVPGVVLSNAGAMGAVFAIPIPDDLPYPVGMNSCTVSFGVNDVFDVNGDGVALTVGRLTEPFTVPNSLAMDVLSSLSITVSVGQSRIDADLTEFMENWHNLGAENYGIVIKTAQTAVSPEFVVIEPIDSLAVRYTVIPEVDQ